MKTDFKTENVRTFILIVQICLFILLAVQDCSARILNEKGKVLKEVVEIFRHYKPVIEEQVDDIVQKRGLSKDKIDHILNSKTPASDISVKELNDIAQVVFLRPAHTERKDLKPFNAKFLPYTDHRVFKLFRAIGDIDPVYPKKRKYRYILLNGSTIKNMRQRLHTLVELVKTKKLLVTPATEVVFLTGERDLFPEEDFEQFMDPSPLKLEPSWKKPSSLPSTEDQAAQWIWHQSQLPCSLRSAKMTFVRAKKKSERDTVTQEIIVKRPTTFDTIETWIKGEKPEPGQCISISSQPYVYYQKATTYAAFQKAGLLEKGFSVEGTGTGHQNQTFNHFKENIAVMLDNLTRTINEEVNGLKDSRH